MTDAYIVDGTRTPFGRYGGALSQVRTDDLAAEPMKALMARHADLPWSAVDDVIYGNANQAGEDNRNVARMASLLGGLPVAVPGLTVNRLCGSGLEAVALAARAIKAGEGDFFIAGGVESMSRAPFVMPKATSAFSRSAEVYDTTIGWRFVNPKMQSLYGTDSMPETGENVAEDWGVSRQDQDALALRSQERAAIAQANGRLAREITPVEIAQSKGSAVVVDCDEHPRQTSADQLASLKAPFREGGTVTAGNASGVNDGAAALLVCSTAFVERHNLTPLARIVGAASAGVEPRVMGIGPVPATQKLLSRVGWQLDQLDVIELNEAFAAQAIAVLRSLGIDEASEKVNPNGGAIALGHPLGASGARLALTAAMELHLTGAQKALCTMCVGVGQGLAVALEGVD